MLIRLLFIQRNTMEAVGEGTLFIADDSWYEADYRI